MARIGGFETEVRAFVGDLRGPDAGRFLAETHRALHGDVIRDQTARAGIPPDFTHAVDGRIGAAFEVARRHIVTAYDYRREIAIFTRAALVAASPRDSGRYASSHIFLVNGRQTAQLPKEIPDTAEIIVTNTVPYARRLEIGRTVSGRWFVVKVPPRIYEGVARRVVGPQYRDLASIVFDYVDLTDPYITKGGLSARYGTGKIGPRGGGTSRKRYQKPGTAVRYPAIIIRPL